MKKLMIIGASILQLPGILKAKEMGYEVAVLDYNPDAIGVPYADKFYNVSTIDVEKVVEAAKEYKPDGIITLASDMPMRSVAAASKELGLNAISHETAVKATDKNEMIKAFKEHDVPSPWFFTVTTMDEVLEIKDKVSYPCIVKPVDNSGSRGISLCNNFDRLKESFIYALENSRGSGVLVEEYLQGKEISVETMTNDGKTTVLAITDKLTTGAPRFVEMGHSQPADFDANTLEKIKEVAIKAVEAVGINAGPAHVEMMVTKDGPKMIELGARMGGDCITTHLVPLSTGIDMIAATIETACSNIPDITPKFQKGSAIRYFDVPKGVITQISGIEEAEKIEGVKQISFVKSVGDTVGDITNSADRAGFVIAQGKDAKTAVEICEKAIKTIKISVS